MAKRISSSAVNWALIMESLESTDKAKLSLLKAANEKYLREVSTRVSELPKIDWNSYKARISVPGMVDSFQKAYEGLNIPYPSDKGALGEAEKLNSDIIKHANKVEEELKTTIKELQDKLKQLETVMKYSEMTLEEYYLAKPEENMNSGKLWPPKLEPPPNSRGEKLQ